MSNAIQIFKLLFGFDLLKLNVFQRNKKSSYLCTIFFILKITKYIECLGVHPPFHQDGWKNFEMLHNALQVVVEMPPQKKIACCRQFALRAL